MNASGTKAILTQSTGAIEVALSTAWNWTTMSLTDTYTYDESRLGALMYILADESQSFRSSSGTIYNNKYGDSTSLTLPTSVNVNGLSTSDNVLNPSPDTEYIYKCITSNGGTNVTRFSLGSVNLF